MPLPTHLARYDALLDLLAEQIVREIVAERGAPADRAEPDAAPGAADAPVEVASMGGFHKSWQASICSGDDAK